MQQIPAIKPPQYPFNKVMIVYMVIVAVYGTAAYFISPWSVLGFMATKEMVMILIDAYRTQKYLDDVTNGMNKFLTTLNEEANKKR